MSVVNRKQHDFLVNKYGDGFVARCGHEECADSMEMVGITLASSLADYDVRGDQFAAIVMDLIGSLQRICNQNPVLAGLLGMDKAIHVATRMCALAYHRHLEEYPDDVPEPDDEEGSDLWPSES